MNEMIKKKKIKKKWFRRTYDRRHSWRGWLTRASQSSNRLTWACIWERKEGKRENQKKIIRWQMTKIIKYKHTHRRWIWSSSRWREGRWPRSTTSSKCTMKTSSKHRWVSWASCWVGGRWRGGKALRLCSVGMWEWNGAFSENNHVEWWWIHLHWVQWKQPRCMSRELGPFHCTRSDWGEKPSVGENNPSTFQRIIKRSQKNSS